MRISSLDHQIAAAERAVTDAIRRRDTRGSHHAINHLRALRTKRLRRENRWASIRAWLGPLGRITATVAMFVLAAALWCIVDAPDAYAATAVTAAPSAFDIAALWGLLVLALSWLYVRAMDAMDKLDNDDK